MVRRAQGSTLSVVCHLAARHLPSLLRLGGFPWRNGFSNSVKAFWATAIALGASVIMIIFVDTKLYFYLLPSRCTLDVPVISSHYLPHHTHSLNTLNIITMPAIMSTAALDKQSVNGLALIDVRPLEHFPQCTSVSTCHHRVSPRLQARIRRAPSKHDPRCELAACSCEGCFNAMRRQ